MSKKSCQFLYVGSLYEVGQDFLYIQYLDMDGKDKICVMKDVLVIVTIN